MSGVGGAKQGEIQAIELRERFVDRDELIPASQSKRGQICIHPELWRGRISQRELLPVTFQPRGLLVEESDPVVGEERLVIRPRLLVAQGLNTISAHDGAIGEKPEKCLLCYTAKVHRCGIGNGLEPISNDGVVRVCRDDQ